MNESSTTASGELSEGVAKPSGETAEELLQAVIGELALPKPQVLAIEAMMWGNSAVAAARRAGVHRATVYRWMKDDPAFRDGLARCRAVVRFSMHERLLSMADDCLDAIETAIHNGNAHVAMRLLNLLGVFEQCQPEGEQV